MCIKRKNFVTCCTIVLLTEFNIRRENEDNECWYYSTVTQFDELMSVLDDQEFEAALCREINEFRTEIMKQMEITESLTNQAKGSKKSYLEAEDSMFVLLFVSKPK